MNHFTNRQTLLLCLLSTGLGALLSPLSRSQAQPPQTTEVGTSSQLAETPQPLATPSVAPPASSDASPPARTTRAVGTITGQGTTGYISKFTGTNAIGNSVIYENAGKIGIGLTNPAGLLSIKGTASNVYPLFALNTTAGTAILGNSTGGVGVYGLNTGATNSAGVLGESSSTSANATGVQGTSKATSPSTNAAGVRGINNGTNANGYGVYGSHAGAGSGVYGSSISGIGVSGSSNTGSGVAGTTSSNATVAGDFRNMDTSSLQKGVAVSGLSATGSSSLIHPNNAFYSAAGQFSGPNGLIGAASYSSGYGVIGVAPPGGNGYGIYSYGNAYIAGKLTVSNNENVIGNLSVSGTLSKGAGSFKIDHPQHPATEYLSHSFVESPDMMNVYNGNATTNARGEAWVQLPSYFQSLNRNFRYQLTPIGQFAQVIVGQKIRGNRFLIRTDKPNIEVSWQVTGVRNDAYARQNRIRVEENKLANERGKYLYPAGFGFGKDRQIGVPLTQLAKR